MIELQSTINCMPQVEAFVENAVEKYRVAPDVYGNILVSVTEAVTNAIVHGNARDDNKKVRLEIVRDDKALTFKVKDEGPGFDHAVVPDPTAPENLLREGGRGVFMMKQLSDLVVFSDNGSTVEMVFKV